MGLRGSCLAQAQRGPVQGERGNRGILAFALLQQAAADHGTGLSDTRACLGYINAVGAAAFAVACGLAVERSLRACHEPLSAVGRVDSVVKQFIEHGFEEAPALQTIVR